MSKQSWPLDHDLFLRSAADTIRRLRNHACIALWCGGNEQTPAADIDAAMRIMLARRPTRSAHGYEHILADIQDSSRSSACAARRGQKGVPLTCLDASRAYVSGSLWSGFGEGHGAFSDGPYGCQSPAAFFDPAFYPYAFNPEVRSPFSSHALVCWHHSQHRSKHQSMLALSQDAAWLQKGCRLVWLVFQDLAGQSCQTELCSPCCLSGVPAFQVGSVGVPEYETMCKIFLDPSQAAYPQFAVTPLGLIQVRPLSSGLVYAAAYRISKGVPKRFHCNLIWNGSALLAQSVIASVCLQAYHMAAVM